ncbi:fused MFS/spermidine synthase [Actinomycetaceae bacterium MB13-C1-2]|nr:fused MFS/spermidine synthase [Actinomycetaceae bacterium MB13-C1-2]
MAKGRASSRKTHSVEAATAGGLILRLDGSILTLTTAGTEQSRLDLDRPDVLDFEYMQHLDLLLGSRHREAERLRVLHGGAGACALPLHWAQKYPAASQVAVDTDAEMLGMLKEWKVLSPRSRIKLRVGDAREVLEGSGATYDVIVRDAFAGESTPRSLTTTGWHELVRSRLRPGGTYLANIAHGATSSWTRGQAGSITSKSDVAAAFSVFPSLVAIADRKVWRGDRRGNISLAAWERGEMDREWLEQQVRRLPLPVAVYSRPEIATWLAGVDPSRDSA